MTDEPADSATNDLRDLRRAHFLGHPEVVQQLRDEYLLRQVVALEKIAAALLHPVAASAPDTRYTFPDTRYPFYVDERRWWRDALR